MCLCSVRLGGPKKPFAPHPCIMLALLCLASVPAFLGLACTADLTCTSWLACIADLTRTSLTACTADLTCTSWLACTADLACTSWLACTAELRRQQSPDSARVQAAGSAAELSSATGYPQQPWHPRIHCRCDLHPPRLFLVSGHAPPYLHRACSVLPCLHLPISIVHVVSCRACTSQCPSRRQHPAMFAPPYYAGSVLLGLRRAKQMPGMARSKALSRQVHALASGPIGVTPRGWRVEWEALRKGASLQCTSAAPWKQALCVSVCVRASVYKHMCCVHVCTEGGPAEVWVSQNP